MAKRITLTEDDLKRIERVNALEREGLSLKDIAKELELAEQKFRNWIYSRCDRDADNTLVPKKDIRLEDDTRPPEIPESPTAANAYPAMAISEIDIGTRCRKDVGDIASLAQSISEIELLQPPVVTPDNNLICGYRRIEACKLLGWTEIPVRVMDIDNALRGEYDENAFRKNFLPSERVAIADAMRRHLEAKARERQIEHLRNVGHADERANCPDEEPGQTGRVNDILSGFAGVSRKTHEKETKVVRAAEENPDYQDLVEKMDLTQKVDGAYKELLKRQRMAELKPNTDNTFSTKVEVVQAEPLAWLTDHDGKYDCLITEAPCSSRRRRSSCSDCDYGNGICNDPETWLGAVTGALNDDGVGFLFCQPHSVCALMQHLYDLEYPVVSMFIWHHPNHVKGKDNPDLVPVSYHIILQFGAVLQPRNHSQDVWSLSAPSCLRKDGVLQRIEKPIELIEWLVEIGCKPGGKVLDPLAYTGYTGLACLKSGRECTLIEPDEELVSIIRERLPAGGGYEDNDGAETDTSGVEPDEELVRVIREGLPAGYEDDDGAETDAWDEERVRIIHERRPAAYSDEDDDGAN